MHPCCSSAALTTVIELPEFRCIPSDQSEFNSLPSEHQASGKGPCQVFQALRPVHACTDLSRRELRSLSLCACIEGTAYSPDHCSSGQDLPSLWGYCLKRLSSVDSILPADPSRPRVEPQPTPTLRSELSGKQAGTKKMAWSIFSSGGLKLNIAFELLALYRNNFPPGLKHGPSIGCSDGAPKPCKRKPLRPSS